MDKFAVIVAGGTGSRMGNSVPKQFIEVGGKPLLLYTIDAFLKAFVDIQLMVVLPEIHLETGKAFIEKAYANSSSIRVTTGGVTRFESVRNGILHAPDSSIIFVHDAVRCMVSPELIRNCYEVAKSKGSAIPVVSIKDSIRQITISGSEVVNRETLRAVQTPQTFHSEILKQAFALPYNEAFTDEATVVEFSGGTVELMEGEETNIKVTYPADLLLAEQYFLKASQSF
ncbi:MAG: 2-C-methyl-D-erythritol 4-phosphate cytidylyltransferase [Sphingobacteriales bacterium]|jgi:2-C-methyl-D-erythritol 4-phosphate cytidylyltransferase